MLTSSVLAVICCHVLSFLFAGEDGEHTWEGTFSPSPETRGSLLPAALRQHPVSGGVVTVTPTLQLGLHQHGIDLSTTCYHPILFRICYGCIVTSHAHIQSI